MANGVNRFGLQPVTSGKLAGSFALYVDDKPYLAVLTEFEQTFAGKIAGAYAPGLHIADLSINSQGAVPYVCDCGDEDCWFITVQISYVSDGGNDYVIWHRWANPYRNDKSQAGQGMYWDYSALPPLVFEKQQYLAVINAAKASK